MRNCIIISIIFITHFSIAQPSFQNNWVLIDTNVITSNALRRVMNKVTGKTGFINNQGNLIIPCIYNYATPFQDGHALVGKKIKYEQQKQLDTLILRVTDRPVWKPDSITLEGIIDTNGNEFIPCQYRTLKYGREGLFPVKQVLPFGEYEHELWGFVDAQNRIIIPFQFYGAEPFYNGQAYVMKKMKDNLQHFMIDKTGKCVKDCPR